MTPLWYAEDLEELAAWRIAVDSSAVPDGNPQAAFVVDGHAVGLTVPYFDDRPAGREGADVRVDVECVDPSRRGVDVVQRRAARCPRQTIGN